MVKFVEREGGDSVICDGLRACLAGPQLPAIGNSEEERRIRPYQTSSKDDDGRSGASKVIHRRKQD